MDKIRLQKYFTDCGILSRRAAETEIAAGTVTVNGNVASVGDKVSPGVDIICWRGKLIENKAQGTGHTYLMLHKPSGYVTTMSDDRGRPCVTDLIADVPNRVYPVGRLDMYSEGLLLFTDDGVLANRLTHPSHSIAKVYLVKLKGALGEEDVKRLTAPMQLDGYTLRPVEVKLCKSGETDRGGTVYSVLRITLYEGRNRQIRRMCDVAGLTVLRLRRIAVGSIRLRNLPAGKWRYLTKEEIQYLEST